MAGLVFTLSDVAGAAASGGGGAMLQDAVSLTSDGEGFCALLATGGVDCWGLNTSGELGNGTTVDSDVPVAVAGITNATSVATDGFGYCAVLTSGAVACWGDNSSGELGNGTPGNETSSDYSDVPVAVTGLTGVASVTGTGGVGGANTYCALLAAGRVDCWGFNGSGDLGIGNTTTVSSDVPLPVVDLTDATSVTFGALETACAVLTTGGIDCWGDNYIVPGLGDGSSAQWSTVPVPVTGITDAASLTPGGLGLCAALSTATVDCWGSNGFGELGDGETTDSGVPVAVSGLTGVTVLTSNGDGYCAIVTTGGIDCWGYNEQGDLGNGTTSMDSDVPVSVTGVTTAVAIGSDVAGSCAVLTSGGVDCWGDNTYGQLGNGTTGGETSSADSDVPVVVSGVSDATTITGSNGGDYCALLATGGVDCWGANTSGELGNGTTVDSDIPVAVDAAGAIDQPAITSLSPTSGTTAGGTSVTITGTGLSDATAVHFGTTAATITADSATSITATSPAGAAGIVIVTVTTAGGTSNAETYAFVAPSTGKAPVVKLVFPRSGSTAGGRLVLIEGSNFTGTTSVDFGLEPALFLVLIPNWIVARSPAAPVGTADITVTTAAGTSATGTADEYTYVVAPPSITSLSNYSTGPTGGTTVTITGTGLAGATAVDFGSAAATITADTATSITVTIPPGTKGLTAVTITTANGTSLPAPFLYT